MSWYKKANTINITMTPAEKDWADWAISPMIDYWSTESGAYDRDGEIYKEDQIPSIQGNLLILPSVPEIIEDLLYRLEEQAYDVCATDVNSEQQQSARCRSANNLSNKIRGVI
jgi:hypothetical protein